jgi:protein-S-isoprenylcysteine O-methyltransferase Ste14
MIQHRKESDLMSHRTRDLPPLAGPSSLIRELRYHEASRQGLAVVLLLIYALTSQPSELSVALGMPLAFVGMLVRFYASGFVMKNKELATHGPYALVRHPLYTGNILLIVGFAAAGATFWGLPLAIIFFWFYYPPAIEYEDRKLRVLFTEQWDRWAQGVPALIPKLGNAARMAGGSWSLVKSTRQNGEIVIVIYTLICMWLVIERLS